jgi:Domain of unknown function (DUF4326)
VGWHKPPDGVCCDRSSRWGNPFDWRILGRTEAARLYKAALLEGRLPITVEDVRCELRGKRARAFSDVVRSYLAMEIGWEVEVLKGAVKDLSSERPVLLDSSLIQYIKTHRSDSDLRWINFDALLSDQPPPRRKKEPKHRH